MHDDLHPLPLIRASSLAHTQPKERRYLDGHNLFPEGRLTLFSGGGAAGKTTILLQLSAAIASKKEAFWLGKPVRMHGAALFVSTEDDLDDLHRKLFEIAADDPTVDIAGLGALHILDLTTADERWMLHTERGKVAKTKLFRRMEKAIITENIKLIVFDNKAQLSDVDEIKRSLATTTIRAFDQIAISFGITTVLLQHPSLTGAKTGTSGSTGNQNTTRSHVHMARPDEKGEQESTGLDDGKRILRVEKANGQQMGREINLQWTMGVYRCTDEPPRAGADIGRGDRAERVFMKLLLARMERGQRVSANDQSPVYAPKAFAKMEGREGVNLREFERAMERLFTAKKIEIEVLYPGKNREKQWLRPTREG